MASKKMARRGNTALSAEKQAEIESRLSGMKDRVVQAQGRMIKTDNKRFTFPDGTVIKPPMEVVIVEFMPWNAYYDPDIPFDKDNPQPPICYAFNENPRELHPSPNGSDIQCDGPCSDCKWDEFGTSPTGKGKACKNSRLFAILPPDAEKGDEMMLLAASPTAIKRFDTYVSELADVEGLLPVMAITSLDFVDGESFATLTFDFVEPNPDPAFFLDYTARAKEMLTNEPTYETEEEKPVKTTKKKVAKKKVAKKKVSSRRRG